MKKIYALVVIGILFSIQSFAQFAVGHTQIDFVDPDRGNRVIQTEVYYPADVTGDDVPATAGQYPVIVFGHGFVMAWSAYQNLWEEFVPRGYIMAFPRTEGNIFATDHQQFGFDLQFLVTEMQAEGANASSPFFGAVSPETALMGHSMGGGAAFLAADSLCVNGNTNLKTLIGLAPAESSTNGVSSINSAKSVTVPSIVLSGSQDGVTPPADHHIPMYDSLATDCKTFIDVTGGAHCYFADPNTNCDFGEGSSSTGISITRTQQHEITFDFVNLWLDYMLKSDCSSFSIFQDSLNSSPRIAFEQDCNVSGLNVSVATTDVNCVGGSDGTATTTVTGGTSPYTENWNGEDPNALAAGTYTVDVSDAGGCLVSKSITITEPTAGISVSSTTTDATCTASNGTATLSLSGGNPPYFADWGGENPNALAAGFYDVTITDNSACMATHSLTITADNSNVPSTTLTTTEVVCNGSNTGTASVAITGGTSPYSQDWGGANQNALFAGSYTLTVGDANGCESIQNFTITEPASITVTSTTTIATCGGNDGTATLTITGGNAPYVQDWQGENPNSLAAGSYTVNVVDNNACLEQHTVFINNATPNVSVVTTDASCFASPNGTATATASGGVTPYSYDWNGEIPDSLRAGVYVVQVTDGSGCVTSESFTITEPPMISVTHVSTDATCGNNDGTAVLTISGGQPPYVEDWQGEDPNALGAGVYTVIISDGTACGNQEVVTINDNGAPSLILSSTDVLCSGNNDGTAQINSIMGGTAPYTISWNVADTNALAAGVYSVDVTDNNGCFSVESVTIGEPNTLVLSTTVTDATCGANDGTATAIVSGGTAPFTENWFGEDPNALTSGSYMVEITDVNGCTTQKSFTISDGGAPSLSVNTTNVACFGDSTGTAVANVTGGTSPYTEDWSGMDPNALAAGSYSLVVTDSNGCESTQLFSISEPSELTASAVVTPANCGASDGSVVLTISGGTNPFTEDWSGANPTALSSGVYPVLITDFNGCMFSDTFAITNVGAPTLSVGSTDALCFGSSDGSATVSASGGTSPYTENWGGANPNTLAAGTYTVVITDSLGCSSTEQVQINEPAPVVVTANTLDASCGNADGVAVLNVSGGTAPYSEDWGANNPNSLAAGTYTVMVTDNNGCSETTQVSVGSSNGPNVIANVTDVSCNGTNDGAINLSVSGGTLPYSTDWGSVDNSALAAGVYSYTVTDGSGCVITQTATVVEPTGLQVSGIVISEIIDDDGAIDITVSGGTPPYTYYWSTEMHVEDQNNLDAGFYYVIVTDASGCDLDTTFRVFDPDSTTAITELNEERFRIYPNPITQFVTVDLGDVNSAQMVILTNLGQAVLRQTVLSKQEIDFSELATGIYFIQINTGKEVQTVRITKN